MKVILFNIWDFFYLFTVIRKENRNLKAKGNNRFTKLLVLVSGLFLENMKFNLLHLFVFKCSLAI